MAQSGYLFLEDGKWKVRYRIKDEEGKWRWAPLHVLGTKREFPKRSDAKVAKDDFMANQRIRTRLASAPRPPQLLSNLPSRHTFLTLRKRECIISTLQRLRPIGDTGENISNLCYGAR